MAKAALEKKAFEVIPDYMVKQNRPYSVVDVYTNLRQEFGKPLVIKALEAGVASGVLKEKPIGKQKIYYADQDKFEKYDESAIKDYDDKINAASKELDELTAEWKTLQNELRGFAGAQSTSQLKETAATLEATIADLETRVEALESNSKNGDDLKAEGKKVKEDQARVEKLLSSRKRKTKEMVSAIRDGCPLPKKQLYDSIGLDLLDGEM